MPFKVLNVQILAVCKIVNIINSNKNRVVVVSPPIRCSQVSLSAFVLPEERKNWSCINELSGW